MLWHTRGIHRMWTRGQLFISNEYNIIQYEKLGHTHNVCWLAESEARAVVRWWQIGNQRLKNQKAAAK